MHESQDKTFTRYIHVHGARQHNLKNVTVAIPREAMTVMTGVSGSGKSSLAFDTLYAEGRRMYVESLSVQARQYLERLARPEVDRIEGLPPTIAVEQRHMQPSPRATVATTTDIHDYLRVLFARAGQAQCPHCGSVIDRTSTAQIVDAILDLPPGMRCLILAPVVRDQPGTHEGLFEDMVRQGFVRARVNGNVVGLDDRPRLDAGERHSIDIVVDRVIIKAGIGQRLADAVEMATRASGGLVAVASDQASAGDEPLMFSTTLVCANHPEIKLEELSPPMFSFHSPAGACGVCHGLGVKRSFDASLVVPDRSLPVSAQAIVPWKLAGPRRVAAWERELQGFLAQHQLRDGVRFDELHDDVLSLLMEGDVVVAGEESDTLVWEGLLPGLERLLDVTESSSLRQKLQRFQVEDVCPGCSGTRLQASSLWVKVGGRSIAEVTQQTIAGARDFFSSLSWSKEKAAIATPLVDGVVRRLNLLCELGVEYLTLDRPSDSLSGGELQRIRLASHIGGGLTGVCYVLDEPTAGLHPRDSHRLAGTLRSLVEAENTVIVVEHDEEVIRSADYVVDIGPGAGEAGGELVMAGSVQALLEHPTSITGRYLSGREKLAIPPLRRPVDESACLYVEDASEHNLQHISVRIPLGRLVVVTGVSGSGKSTLVHQIVVRHLKRMLHGSNEKPGAFGSMKGAEQIGAVVEVDQSPIGRTARSTPATYCGIVDLIRELFAKTREAKLRGYSAKRFSFNIKAPVGGRCEDCQGQGQKRIAMHFMPDMYVTCQTCLGKRFNRETLEVRYRGMNMADVLEMRVEEAVAFFDSFEKIQRRLLSLKNVGLGYMQLGQPSATLSGGEAQRIKLAAELHKTPASHTLYVLDEPTTGLHWRDIHHLMEVLHQLVDRGHSVLVIEHHTGVVAQADWVVDLGPEGGEQGGRVVSEGTPEEVAACAASHTGKYLKQWLQRT